MNIRTSKPTKGNKFYITISKGGWSRCCQGKPTDTYCNVLSNCVGYACGRFNEIIGSMKYATLNCNAENFIERAKSLGLKISNTPTLGGIMVWQKGNTLNSSDGAGHVAIVEKIIDSNTIMTSESGYNSFAFWNSTRKNSNGRWGQASGYKFRGCIINPAVKTISNKTNNNVKLLQNYLNKNYGFNLTCDGIYGNNTKIAFIKSLQICLKVKADGIFGNKTLNACYNLKRGMKGNIIGLIQYALLIKGYGISVDNDYGKATEKIVKLYQKNNKLTSDGICGKKTIERLFK